MSYSTGLHDRARLYKPAFARLHRSFGYDLAQPVRRDFDHALAGYGNDLDRVVADTAPRDYTALEHAHDLVGAVRWNVEPALRRAARRVRKT